MRAFSYYSFYRKFDSIRFITTFDLLDFNTNFSKFKLIIIKIYLQLKQNEYFTSSLFAIIAIAFQNHYLELKFFFHFLLSPMLLYK